MSGAARLDHLVVAATSLEAGIDWCERTLGVTPGPGGEHPLMGTHNRLLRLPCAHAPAHLPPPYLEIIAINPAATPMRSPGQRRWFDLDDPALQAQLAAQGPALIHWVVRVPHVDAAVTALAGQGLDRGTVVPAARLTPAGLLQWRITVRDDGQRLFDGALPTLIEWGDRHPASDLPDSGLSLQQLRLQHPQAGALRAACLAIGLDGLDIRTGPPQIAVALNSPAGTVELHSP